MTPCSCSLTVWVIGSGVQLFFSCVIYYLGWGLMCLFFPLHLLCPCLRVPYFAGWTEGISSSEPGMMEVLVEFGPYDHKHTQMFDPDKLWNLTMVLDCLRAGLTEQQGGVEKLEWWMSLKQTEIENIVCFLSWICTCSCRCWYWTSQSCNFFKVKAWKACRNQGLQHPMNYHVLLWPNLLLAQ